MISETTWNRPNRFRGEAPLYLAAYGALQHSDAIVHFAWDSAGWAVKPGYFMQPWTLMTPALVGQFPAAALIFRRGLVAAGDVLADVRLNKESLLRLEGTPLPQDAALDELRLRDPPAVSESKPGGRIDPLLHYAGRTEVRFVSGPGSIRVSDLKTLIDHAAKTVTSSTGELKLDYGAGILTINASRAQGVSGLLQSAGHFETRDLVIDSEMELGHIVAVALDNLPIARSTRILLQVMSEEKASGFQSEPGAAGVNRIVNIGTDPWLVRSLKGAIRLKRPDASQLKVTPLDFNGYPQASIGTADALKLQPTTLYYLINN